jgi:hypothetical protein
LLLVRRRFALRDAAVANVLLVRRRFALRDAAVANGTLQDFVQPGSACLANSLYLFAARR